MTTASIRNNQLNLMARRKGYNLALSHFRAAQEFAGNVSDGYNLADVLNSALDEGVIEDYQLRPIVHILLVEKFVYAFDSQNLQDRVESIDLLSKTVRNWTNLQVVLVYLDANDGIHLLNPEILTPWEAVLPLAKDECMVCYVGSLAEIKPAELASAVKGVYKLLYGSKLRMKPVFQTNRPGKKFIVPEEKRKAVVIPESTYLDSVHEETTRPASATASIAPGVRTKKTTAVKIAVNVTNELFHNGNVEAWKKIIESYKLKYPGLDVLIWYEGERINDINALFKWGKVKHGTPIMFSVAGDSPGELSKLRKYLFEGASSRFEAFLHGPHGTVLRLF